MMFELIYTDLNKWLKHFEGMDSSIPWKFGVEGMDSSIPWKFGDQLD